MTHFTSTNQTPSARGMRIRVKSSIRAYRDAIAHIAPHRPDIAEMIRKGDAGWDDRLWTIRSELKFYRSIFRAELAHARGEHLNRWYIDEAA